MPLMNNDIKIAKLNPTEENLIHKYQDLKFLSPDSGKNFDRDAFYDSELHLTSFKTKDMNIDINDIVFYNNMPGVWSVWDSDKCLDVYETTNIGKSISKWKKKYENPNRFNGDGWEKEIFEYCKNLTSYPVFKLVALNVKKSFYRKTIEIQYAYNNKALLWEPRPGN